MKKVFLILAISAMSFTGCQNDDEPTQDNRTVAKSSEDLNLSLEFNGDDAPVVYNWEDVYEVQRIDCHTDLKASQGTYLITSGGQSYVGTWSDKPSVGAPRPGVHYFQKNGFYFTTELNTSGLDCFDIWGIEKSNNDEEISPELIAEITDIANYMHSEKLTSYGSWTVICGGGKEYVGDIYFKYMKYTADDGSSVVYKVTFKHLPSTEHIGDNDTVINVSLAGPIWDC